MSYLELNTGDLIIGQHLEEQYVVTRVEPRPSCARVHSNDEGEILRFGLEGTMSFPARVVGSITLTIIAEKLAIAYELDDVTEIMERLKEQRSLGPVQYPASE
jgi:hypothetical protein